MHLENLDLNLLVAIDAILRRRSVTAAAEELHITQSAMSSALNRARQHFENDLFYYDGQAMVPTTFGRELELRIPDMVTQLRGLSRMRSTSDLSSLNRHFTIIASDYVSAVFVSKLTKHLSAIAPNISLSIMPYTREAIRQFQRGVIDFLIGPEFALEAQNSAELLFEDRFKCVLWSENPVVKNGFSADAFYKSPMVVTNFFLENGKSHFERWLQKQVEEVHVVATLPSFVVLPHFVAGTCNIATIHQRLIPHFEANPELTFQDPPVDIPPLKEHLVTAEKHKYDIDAQLLAEVMRNISKTI